MKEIVLESDGIDVTNALKSFLEEKKRYVLSRNKELSDFKIELRLGDGCLPDANVVARGIAIMGDRELVVSSVSKSSYAALGTMIYKLEHELRRIRRAGLCKKEPTGNGKTMMGGDVLEHFTAEAARGSVKRGAGYLIYGSDVV